MQDEFDKLTAWVSHPFTTPIPAWKVWVAVLVILVLAWFVFDNLSILKEAI